MKEIISFEKSLSKEIISIFDKTLDSEGFIVEKSNPTQRVLTPDGEEIHIEEFAGISKGSEVFVKSDLISLIDFSKRIE